MKITKAGKLKENVQLTTLASPAIILIFIFGYLPLVGLIIAFKDINYIDGIFHSPWVGFDNFKFFFTSGDMLLVTRNTILYNIAIIALTTLLSVAFAIMLNSILRKKLVNLYQTIFFFPYFFSWVIVSYMVFSFMSAPNGIVFTMLEHYGIHKDDFYTNRAYWPYVLIFLSIWKGLGYTSVIYYAGIMGISKDYYEAAEIDGASRFQAIRFITIPLLTPLITIMIILAVGKIFNSDFGLFWIIPRQVGELYPVTQVIDTYVYRMLRVTSDLGSASAAGLYQSVVGFICVLVTNYMAGRYDEDNRAF